MKVYKLKEKLNKLKESDLDYDVQVECNNKKYHVLFAKLVNNNKRETIFTTKYFSIVCKDEIGDRIQ